MAQNKTYLTQVAVGSSTYVIRDPEAVHDLSEFGDPELTATLSANSNPQRFLDNDNTFTVEATLKYKAFSIGQEHLITATSFDAYDGENYQYTKWDNIVDPAGAVLQVTRTISANDTYTTFGYGSQSVSFDACYTDKNRTAKLKQPVITTLVVRPASMIIKSTTQLSQTDLRSAIVKYWKQTAPTAQEGTTRLCAISANKCYYQLNDANAVRDFNIASEVGYYYLVVNDISNNACDLITYKPDPLREDFNKFAEHALTSITQSGEEISGLQKVKVGTVEEDNTTTDQFIKWTVFEYQNVDPSSTMGLKIR